MIDALTDRSLGKWWNKAISDEDPRVDINCKERLSEDPHDPHNWYLHGKNMNEKIDAMLNVEKNQSGEDSILYDDIEYNSERMTKQSWPIASFTAVDGLATGFEELMVKEKIISPLVKREFFHNIGMFLYTRAPKYWRNGELGYGRLTVSLKQVGLNELSCLISKSPSKTLVGTPGKIRTRLLGVNSISLGAVQRVVNLHW